MMKEFDWFSLHTDGHTDLNKLYNDNITNVSLQDKEVYKNKDWVKEEFTDDKGIFDEEGFDMAYTEALQSFNEYDSINQIPSAYYTTVDSKANRERGTTIVNPWTFTKKNNPLNRTLGFIGDNKFSEPTKSLEELAEVNYVWDTKLGKFRDYKAENTLGIFNEQFVLATYDKDEGTNKKGDIKLDKNGKPYFRTLLDGEDSANKLLLSKWNILTDEDSMMNTVDFFDSDDIHKSVGGVIVRTAAELVWKLSPWTRGFATAFSLSLSLAESLSEMFKQGKNLTDDVSGVATANNIQNFVKQFTPGQSQESKQSFFTFDNVGRLVSESVTQLMTQKMIGVKFPKAIGMNPAIGAELSRIYMATTSTSEIINEAKKLDLPKADQALLYIATFAGIYGLFKTDLGSVALKSAGLDAQGLAIKKAVQSVFNKDVVKQFVRKLPEAPLSRKAAILKLGTNLGKQITNLKKYINSNTIGGTAAGEGLEEVSEELLQEGVKGAYNLLSDTGYINNKKKRFKFDNLGEKLFIAGLGGLGGGAVFKLTELHLDGIKSFDTNFIDIIAKGDIDLLIEEINLSFKEDKLSGSKKLSFEVDGDSYKAVTDPEKSQQAIIRDELINMAKAVDVIFKQHGYNQDYDKIRDLYDIDLQNVIDLRFDTTLAADIKELTRNLVEKQVQLNKVLDEGGDATELTKEVNNIAKELKDIQDGKKKDKYLEQGLFVSRAAISNVFGIPTRESIAKEKYNIRYKTLNDKQKNIVNEELDNYYKNKKEIIDEAFNSFKEIKESINVDLVKEANNQETPFVYEIKGSKITRRIKKYEEYDKPSFRSVEYERGLLEELKSIDKKETDEFNKLSKEEKDKLTVETKEYKEANEKYSKAIDNMVKLGKANNLPENVIDSMIDNINEPIIENFYQAVINDRLNNNKEFSKLNDEYKRIQKLDYFKSKLDEELDKIIIDNKGLNEYVNSHLQRLIRNEEEYISQNVDPNSDTNFDLAINKLRAYQAALISKITIDPIVDAFNKKKTDSLAFEDISNSIREIDTLIAQIKNLKLISEINQADPLKTINSTANKHLEQRYKVLSDITTEVENDWNNYLEAILENPFKEGDTKHNIIALDKIERAFKKDVKDSSILIEYLKTATLKDYNKKYSLDTYNTATVLGYITTILNQSDDFYSRYKGVIEEEIVPVYVQEIVIRQLESFLEDTSLYDSVVAESIFGEYQYLNNMIQVSGVGGVGKTTAILNTILNLVKKRVAIFTPQVTQELNLENTLDLPNKTITGLLALFGIDKKVLDNHSDFTVEENDEIHLNFNSFTINKVQKDILDQLDIIVIDESSNLSAVELEYLRKNLDEYNKSRTTPLKFILLGDPKQLGAVYHHNGNTVGFGLNYFGIQTTVPLEVSLRSQYNLLNITLDQINNKIDDVNEAIYNEVSESEVILTTSYTTKDDDFIGYKINGTLEDIPSEGTKVYITTDKVSAQQNDKLGDYIIMTPEEVQGKEFDYVVIEKVPEEYINANAHVNSELLSTLKYLNTMLGRAKKGAVLLEWNDTQLVSFKESVEVDNAIEASKFGTDNTLLDKVREDTLNTLDGLIKNESPNENSIETTKKINYNRLLNRLKKAVEESNEFPNEIDIQKFLDELLLIANDPNIDLSNTVEVNKKLRLAAGRIGNPFRLLNTFTIYIKNEKKYIVKPILEKESTYDDELDKVQYNPTTKNIQEHIELYNTKVSFPDPLLDSTENKLLLYTFHNSGLDIQYLINKYSISSDEAIQVLTIIKNYVYTQDIIGYIDVDSIDSEILDDINNDFSGKSIKLFIRNGKEGDVNFKYENGLLVKDDLSIEGSLRIIAEIGNISFTVAVLPDYREGKRYSNYINTVKKNGSSKFITEEEYNNYIKYHTDLLNTLREYDNGVDMEIDRNALFEKQQGIPFNTGKRTTLGELKKASPGLYFSPIHLIFGRTVVFVSTKDYSGQDYNKLYTEQLLNNTKDIQRIVLDEGSNTLEEFFNLFIKIREESSNQEEFARKFQTIISPYAKSVFANILLELKDDPFIKELFFTKKQVKYKKGFINKSPIELNVTPILDKYGNQVRMGIGKLEIPLYKTPMGAILHRISTLNNEDRNILFGKLQLSENYKKHFPQGIFYNVVAIPFEIGVSIQSDYAIKTEPMYGDVNDIIYSNIESVSLPAYKGTIKQKTNDKLTFNSKDNFTNSEKKLILKEYKKGEDIIINRNGITYRVVLENNVFSLEEINLTSSEIEQTIDNIFKGLDTYKDDREFLINMFIEYDPNNIVQLYNTLNKYDKKIVEKYLNLDYNKYCK